MAIFSEYLILVKKYCTYKLILIYSQRLNLTVRCGDWNLIGTEELHPYQDRIVSNKSIHPLYTGTSGTSEKVNYNFALLHMEKDFDLDLHINPICLPDIPDKKTGAYSKIYTPNGQCPSN